MFTLAIDILRYEENLDENLPITEILIIPMEKIMKHMINEEMTKEYLEL